MKSTMKKIAASLLALLMMIQLVPAFAATYSSGMIAGSAAGYKELMAIVASKGTYVLVGQTLELDVNEDYRPEWNSENPAVATIDKAGVVTAITAGNATITATVKTPQTQTATIVVTVIDPEPILAEDAEGTEGTEEETGDEEQNPVSSEKQALVIVINGENEHVTYDGEEHVLDRYVATASEDFFDETKIKVEGELGVTATDCGFYEVSLEGATFTYDDPEVDAHFVLNNGFLKITPAPVTVTANEAAKNEGEADPELTATVIGLFGEDAIEYTLTREPGEEIGEYAIEATGEEMQGNYRIEYLPGKLSIAGNPVVNIGMGAKIQYYLTDALRSEVSYNGFFKSSHITYWDLNLNLHYVFNMKYGLAIYPIVGVTFVHGHYKNNERIEELETNFWEQFLFGTTDKMYNDREGSIGFNVGAGIQYAIIPNLYANIEGVFKYAGTKDLGPYNAQIGPRFQTTVGLTYRF